MRDCAFKLEESEERRTRRTQRQQREVTNSKSETALAIKHLRDLSPLYLVTFVFALSVLAGFCVSEHEIAVPAPPFSFNFESRGFDQVQQH